ncbi:MAG TPA: abhydrolase domain-containing 18 [Blastocatellia bacterium]|nr:abhydrolase domain-containing 18 [Blastocatellia bacterium]
MLRSIMHRLEYRVYARDISKRVVRPFEWGLNFLGNGPGVEAPRQYLRQFNAEVLAASDHFFTPSPIGRSEFDFDGSYLRFPSELVTPYEKNNLVHARFFPAGSNDRAVIISPNWNAVEESHVSLCRLLNRFGISALRLSLPYHDRRMPEELNRADYMVSANIGRTIQAVRQAVLDIRRGVDWLQWQGFSSIGVMGSSIGSCVSWLAMIHDERIQTGVFNLISSWFGDVVWRALTTLHVRQALETELTADEVREVWTTISPIAYSAQLRQLKRPVLLISANYDLTFLPDLTQLFLDDCERFAVPARKIFLPCGHYTLGMAPFKYLDAWHIVNFFRKFWR